MTHDELMAKQPDAQQRIALELFNIARSTHSFKYWYSLYKAWTKGGSDKALEMYSDDRFRNKC